MIEDHLHTTPFLCWLTLRWIHSVKYNVHGSNFGIIKFAQTVLISL